MMSELRERKSENKQRYNVDERDVQYFSAFANTWWDDTGELKVLREMNQVRVPFIRNGLIVNNDPEYWVEGQTSNTLKGFKILDVGCGAGVLSEPLGLYGAEVVGIDPSKDLIEAANNHLSKTKETHKLNVSYYSETIEEHVMKYREKYDAIIASEVVEHVVDKKAFLKSCIEALKPGGSIFVTTLNKNWFSWICAIIFAEFILGILPKHTHIYDQFISPGDVKDMLKELNCRTIKILGWRNEWFWSKYKFQSNTSIQYGLHAIKQAKTDNFH
ncbi:CLUMA_CG018882, isoform A [Clunio marinus]|uniref:Ubiquinone biosynthesis O-methyltransferase, mitochondrial n=1 Tax=Clunio marinus TaxID=568069 RepID=A0A1J1J3H8_9DIPT|nr:CLUMA_CG018882, isoform A [Clunio marinus]